MAEPDILYEVPIATEWNEPSTFKPKEKEDEIKSRQMWTVISQPFIWMLSWLVWKFCEYRGKLSIPDFYLSLRSAEIPWKISATSSSVGTSTKPDTIIITAVATEDRLEIRRSTDDFHKAIGQIPLRLDEFSSCRRLAWSDDGKRLAYGGSDGLLTLLDYPSLTTKSIHISPSWNVGKEIVRSRLVIGIVWISDESRRESILLATADASLKFISLKDDELQQIAVINFRQLSPGFCKGISSISFARNHNLLLIGSTVNTTLSEEPKSFWSAGLSLWRMVDEEPFLAAVFDDQTFEAQHAKKLFSNFSLAKDGISKMALNKSESLLATLFISGSLAIWSFPSLRLKRFWTFETIPEYCSTKFGTTLPKSHSSKNMVHFPVDVKWWSDSAIILNQAGGAVSLLNISSRELTNISHGSFEQFHPGSLITDSFGDKFLILEANLSGDDWRKNSSIDSDGQDSPDNSMSSGDRSITTSFMSETLASLGMTDDSRGISERKKMNYYRLNCFQSASPAQFFQRKLASEEYGEALLIAERFGLDRDLVYQSRWLKNPITKNTISDFLNRIGNVSWVLRECLDRAPSDPDVANQLLDIGLGLTDYSKIFAQKNTKIDSDELSPEQRTLIAHRRQLLHFKRMLAIYEEMLGGGEKALRYFLTEEYQQMRQKSPVQLAYDLAHAGKLEELHTLHFLCFEEVQNRWLDILSNIPETISANNYLFLIPSVLNGQIVQGSHSKQVELDWSEKEPFDGIGSTEKLLVVGVVEELSADALGGWFERRVVEVEERCGMIDNALELIQIAKVRAPENVDLDGLKDELETLKSLVYHSGQVDLTLEGLSNLTDIQILRLFDQNSADFTADLRNLMAPFVERCEKRSPGSRLSLWRDFLLHSLKSTLDKCVQIFQQCAPNVSSPLLTNIEDIVDLSLDCILACTQLDQLPNAKSIVDLLPSYLVGQNSPGKSKTLADQLKNMREILRCCEFARGFGIQIIPKSLLQIQTQPPTSISFVEHLVKAISSKVPGWTDAELHDIFSKYLRICQGVFASIGEEKAVQIFVKALLSSGRVNYIQTAVKFLDLPNRATNKTDSYWMMNNQIPEKESREILLNVGREYFSTADNWKDNKIQHARRCFELIGANQELKLIDGLTLLHACGIDADPLDIRTSHDRFGYIQQILQTNPDVYKYHQRLLELADLLDIEKRNRIVEAVAEKAFLKKDYGFCRELCVQLIEEGHESCWQLCLKLASAEGFADVEFKERILLFALQNCPEEKLAQVVHMKNRLHGIKDANLLEEDVAQNLSPTLIVDPSCAFSTAQIKVSSMKNIVEVLLKINVQIEFLSKEFLKLNYSSDEKLSDRLDAVLLQLAADLLQVDSGLAVAVLGCLSRKTEAENLFDRMDCPQNANILAAYFCALEASLHRAHILEIGEILTQPVRKLISSVTANENREDEAFSAWAELTKKHSRNLIVEDISAEPLETETPVSKLDSTSINIPDKEKFLSNAEYRRNIILRAAATKNVEVLKYVLELAGEFEIAEWEVYAHFVKYLFSSSMKAKEVERILKMTEGNLLASLRANKKEFVRFSGQQIQPLMASADIDLLECYYEFFERVKKPA